jgi:hypothetical protein
MNSKIFDELVKEEIKYVESLLLSKGEEYSSSLDRFHNFNEGSFEVKLSREKYLECLFQKHITSIRDIINTWPTKKASKERVREKITDAINYLLILQVMLLEDTEEVVLNI